MKPSTRIVINTIAQYCRTLLNIILGFYSTRLVLKALGEEDYGTYMLIAGVVTMLAFITNALSNTTQRFLSYNLGKNDSQNQILIFSNSLFIHIAVALLTTILLELTGYFLLDGLLTIPQNRISDAYTLYHCAVAMIFISIITSPFRAVLIAHENLIFVSIVDIIDGFWKIAIAFFITYSTGDRLILYAFLSTGIYVFAFLSFLIYDFIHYNECALPRIKFLDKGWISRLATFAGWSVYSSGCIIGRNQGVSIVLNHFFGTILNAAYGIALQVSGAVNYISSALLLAFNPQIAQAAGINNTDKIIRLSISESKLSLLLISMCAIPIFIFIDEILTFWLGDYPSSTPLLCRMIILSSILDQFTCGLISANRAIGKLRRYSLSVDTVKILTIPSIFVMLHLHCPLQYAIFAYVACEGLSATIRLPIMQRELNFSLLFWYKSVILKSIFPLLFLIGCYLLLSKVSFNLWTFTIGFIVISTIYAMIVYQKSLSKAEKNLVDNMVSRTFRKNG